MRRFLILSVLALVTSLLALGCSSAPQGPKPLMVWSGMDAEYPTLVAQCQRFTQETGIPVEVLKVPFQDLRNKFLIAAPASLGPDVLVGPQDWIGVLVTAGMLAPIPEGTIDTRQFFPVTIDSVKFQQKLYMAPLAMECIALFRNKDLMPQRPQTVPQLVAQAQKIQRQSQGKVRGFYFEIKDLYFSLPFLTAEGAYLLGRDAQGNYVPTDVGIATPGAVRGAEFLRDLVQKDKLIQLGATENISRTIFLENQAAVILNGPWFLKQAKEAGINYAIDPFPLTASGHQPRPVLGVQGFMINTYSKRPAEAAQLISYLESAPNMAQMSLVSGRPPTKMAALQLCQGDPDILAFAKICSECIPMPTHPAVGQIWEPMRQSLEMISKGQVEPAPELQSARERIIQKINLMLE